MSSTTSKTSDQPKRVTSNNSDLSSPSANGTAAAITLPKKLPPIKAPVGLAKGPDLKNCKSKVGSLNNIKHTPASSGVAIPTQKLKWNARSKIGSLDNKEHKPGGGKSKIETRKLEWNTTSKVQSLQNVDHKPKKGNVKIFNESYATKSQSSSAAKKSSTPKSTADNQKSLVDQEKNPTDSAATKSLANDLKGLRL